MKKNYLNPVVETTKMRFNYVICGTTDNNDKPTNPGDKFAPKKRVF